jgi:hypothetical protein
LITAGVICHRGLIRNFADTAALLHHMDVVISVDTAVAHLSGALGRPTWIPLNAYGTDWRWGLESNAVVWYPSVRLFRQTKPGSWVVSILSAGNVLLGENYVRAFVDVRANRLVVRQGEQMASAILGADERSPQEVQNRLTQLLVSTFSRAQSQGSLAVQVDYDLGSLPRLIKLFSERPSGQTLRLESFSQRDSDIADPLVVDIRWQPAPGNGQAAAGAGRNQP